MSQTVSAPMKRTLVLTLVAGISTLAATAHAADGRIDFTGNILGNTCTIKVNGTTAPTAATINMVAARDSDLNGATKTSVPTPFDIVLSSCVVGGKASAYFEPLAANVDANGRLKNNGGTAGNVVLELYDRARSNAAININSTQTTTTRVNISSSSNGGATLQYGVRYYATGVATVGTVKSTVTYNILYE